MPTKHLVELSIFLTMNDKKTSIEKDLEKLFCARIKDEGGLAIKLVPISAIGLSDRLVLRKGARIDFVEFKDEGQDLRPAQKAFAIKITRLGFNYHLIDSYTSLNAFFNRPSTISKIWG